MVSRALQLIKGVTSITLYRSRLCSRARDAITAGTVHPKPRSMGMKAFPDSPRRLITSSIT